MVYSLWKNFQLTGNATFRPLCPRTRIPLLPNTHPVYPENTPMADNVQKNKVGLVLGLQLGHNSFTGWTLVDLYVESPEPKSLTTCQLSAQYPECMGLPVAVNDIEFIRHIMYSDKFHDEIAQLGMSLLLKIWVWRLLILQSTRWMFQTSHEHEWHVCKYTFWSRYWALGRVKCDRYEFYDYRFHFI